MADFSQSAGAISELLGFLVGDQYASAGTKERNRRAAEVLERYRRSSGAGSVMLDARDAEERRTLEEPEPEPGLLGRVGQAVTSPFRALSPSNVAKTIQGPVSEDVYNVENYDDALLALGDIYPPGSRGYEDFAYEIARTRKQEQFNQLANVIAPSIGVSPEVLQEVGPEGTKFIAELMVKTGEDYKLTTIGVAGGTAEQKVLINDRTGAVKAYIGDPIPIQKAGGNELEVEIDPVTGRLVGIRSGQQALGRGVGQADAQLRQRTVTGTRAVAAMADIVRELERPGVVAGTFGEVMARSASALAQAQQAAGVVGLSGGMFDSALQEVGKYSPTTQQILQNRELRAAYYHLAHLIAAHETPGERITENNIKNALIQIGISGDPKQTAAQLRKLSKVFRKDIMVSSSATGGKRVDIREFLPPEDASFLFDDGIPKAVRGRLLDESEGLPPLPGEEYFEEDE